MPVRRALTTAEFEIWECAECRGDGVIGSRGAAYGQGYNYVCASCRGVGRVRVGLDSVEPSTYRWLARCIAAFALGA